MYSYEDIKPGIRHFRSREVKKVQNPNKTWSRIMEGEDYYKTKIGELRDDEWTKIAEQTVHEHGDMSLLEAIEDHVRKYCLWLKENEIREYSLRCLVDEAYKAWIIRGEFPVKLINSEENQYILPEVFEYNGLHYLPLRKFSHDEREMTLKEISVYLKDADIQSAGYDHQAFYRASNDSLADIFMCVEDGKHYIPCEHKMQEFTRDTMKAYDRTEVR